MTDISKERNLEDKDKALHIGSVSHRLSQAEQDELQKCKDSPVYFYNKYVRKKGQKELTEAEYKDFVKQVEYQQNMPLKLRNQERQLSKKWLLTPTNNKER